MVNYGLNYIFDENFARRYRCFPMGFENETLVVAFSSTSESKEAIGHIKEKNQIPSLKQELHSDLDIERLINTYYTIELKNKEIYKRIRTYLAEGKIEDLFNYILQCAGEFNASDIHILKEDEYCFIRFRINGKIKTFSIIEDRYGEVLGRVIKVKGNSDISKTREALDTRMTVMVGGEGIDIRVAIVCTASGEKISLRLLNSKNVPQTLEELGIDVKDVKIIRRALGKSSGTILVTGPTGSGKSTTLRCFINEVNDGTKHIITVEDPVEYKIAGVTQMQVDEKNGNGFSSAVKSILRQDPDIIYIGEIRDEISAGVATKASITGHMVFSSLHTKTANDTINRLENLGIDKNLIHSSLLLIINQRLIAEQCSECL